MAIIKKNTLFQTYDNDSIPLIIVDRQGTIIYGNLNCFQSLNIKPNKLLERSIFQIVHSDEEDMFTPLIQRVLLTQNEQLETEVRVIIDENEYWLKGHINAFQENNETFLKIQFLNISEYKRDKMLLTMTNDVLEMIAKRQSIHCILESITLHIEKHFKTTTYCAIVLLDDNQTKIEKVFAPNLPEEYVSSLLGIEIGPKVGSCGTAMYHKKTVITSDILNCELWDQCRHVALPYGIRASWSVPIFIDGKVIGSFAFYHQVPSSPNPYNLEFIERCAHWVELALEREYTEKKIVEESERRFKVLLDALPDTVVFKDEQRRWIEANQVAIKNFGLEEINYKGLKNEDIARLHPHLKEWAIRAAQTDSFVLDSGESNREVLSLPNEDGTGFEFIDLIKAPFSRETDKKTGIVVIGRDITERKQMERLLEESEEKQKSLFVYNPHALFSMDLEGNIISFNFSFEKILGYNHEETPQSYIPFVDPDYLEMTKHHFQMAKEGIPQTYENVGIHKQGHKVHFRVTNVPIIVDREIIGVYGIAEDITEQKNKEEELQQAKELFESLFSQSADAISIISIDGIVQDANTATEVMFGWKPEEIRGHFCRDVPEKYMDEFRSALRKIQSGKAAVGLETLRQKKDGSFIDVSVTYSPLRDGEGTIIGITAISRDISERKRTEDLLNRSDRLAALGEMAAAVAHEIRNPLTCIKGFIQLFQGNIRREYVDLMLSELKQIEIIVSEFLALSKPHVVEYEENDILSIIQNTLSIVDAQAHMNQITIQFNCHSQLPLIMCDKNKVKRVFINVLINSIDAMDKGGTIEIEVETKNGYIVIRVKDEGSGIPKERLRKLGEPFYSSKEKGTGLGLMICYKIVEEHKGKIVIDSEVGKGTTVEIWLPI